MSHLDLPAFTQKLAAAWPTEGWTDVTVLVAVSGGADSVALMCGLSRLKQQCPGPGRIVAAHFNHRLRGHASESDQRFVVELCDRRQVPLEVGVADAQEISALKEDGLEAVAREARYTFLQATAERVGARYVATAHTWNDQAETILHRIVRGTGLTGLAGMRRARPLGSAVTLIRPLLGIRRFDVVEYLQTIGQAFCEDQSNADVQFTRNRIRHELVPHLEQQYNSGVLDAIVRLGQLAGESQAVIAPLVDELLQRSVTIGSDQSVTIDCEPLVGSARYLIREMLMSVWRVQRWPMQPMGYAQWELLAAMAAVSHDSAPQTFPGNIRVERRGHTLICTRQAMPLNELLT